MVHTRGPRLWLLEASKVRNQHSTLMDGMLTAYQGAGIHRASGRPRLFAHSSFFKHLSRKSQNSVEFIEVPVMDPQRRRLFRKSLLEAWVVFGRLWSIPKNDVLLVTSLLPSAAIIVELIKFFFPSKRLVLMVHGEIEGAGVASRLGWGSFGFYVNIWFWIRKFGTTTALACIDNFIALEILKRFKNSVTPEKIFVIPHPLATALPTKYQDRQVVSCCFIGFDTPNKGFPVFKRVAEVVPEVNFRAIGNGVDQDLSFGGETSIDSIEDYLAAIAACDISVFPYIGGYAASLSAAALDALSCGLHLLATRRGCFVALAEELGSDCVTLFDDDDELRLLLCDRDFIAEKAKSREIRMAKLANSRYGQAGVAQGIERLLMDQGCTFAASRGICHEN